MTGARALESPPLRLITPDDEGPHESGDDARWNESHFLHFVDGESKIAGLSRVASSPNAGFRDGNVSLLLPDGSIGLVRTIEGREDGKEGRAGSLLWTCLTPLRRWRLEYDGPVYVFDRPEEVLALPFGQEKRRSRGLILDLEFEGFHDPVDFYPLTTPRLPVALIDGLFRTPVRAFRALADLPRNLRTVSRLGGARHYEQACAVRGSLVLDGRSFEVKGTGQRDHSWGVRDWRVFTKYRWLAGRFGPDLAFSAVRIDIVGFRPRGGYVWHDGRAARVVEFKLKSVDEPLGLGAREVRAELRTDAGRSYSIRGSVARNLPQTARLGGFETCVTSGLTRFEWEGREGWGSSEYLDQLYP